MTVFHAISQKMYEQQSAEGAQGTDESSENAQDDDVVDADYEVVDDEDNK